MQLDVLGRQELCLLSGLSSLPGKLRAKTEVDEGDIPAEYDEVEGADQQQAYVLRSLQHFSLYAKGERRTCRQHHAACPGDQGRRGWLRGGREGGREVESDGSDRALQPHCRGFRRVYGPALPWWLKPPHPADISPCVPADAPMLIV